MSSSKPAVSARSAVDPGSGPRRRPIRVAMIAAATLATGAALASVPVLLDHPDLPTIDALLTGGESPAAPRDRETTVELLREIATVVERTTDRLGEREMFEVARDARQSVDELRFADIDLIVATRIDLGPLLLTVRELDTAVEGMFVVRDAESIRTALATANLARLRAGQAEAIVGQHAGRVRVRGGSGGSRSTATITFELVGGILDAVEGRLAADQERQAALSEAAFRAEVRAAMSVLAGD